MLAGTLLGCSLKREPLEISDEEALEVLSELVPMSYEINYIFFGEGLPTQSDDQSESTSYVPIDESLSKYLSIASIKMAAEKIYSKKYLSSVYIPMFEGNKKTSEDGLLDSEVSPRYKEIAGELHIDISYNKLKIDSKMYVSSVTVIKKTPDYVLVEGVGEYENGEAVTKRFYLTKENGIWLLDSPTY